MSSSSAARAEREWNHDGHLDGTHWRVRPRYSAYMYLGEQADELSVRPPVTQVSPARSVVYSSRLSGPYWHASPLCSCFLSLSLFPSILLSLSLSLPFSLMTRGASSLIGAATHRILWCTPFRFNLPAGVRVISRTVSSDQKDSKKNFIIIITIITKKKP